MIYKERIVDKEISEQLKITGAVLIRGPKWCGKTTTAKRFANSIIELQDEDNAERYKELADRKPSLLLEGDKPLLIDEWQEIPKLWNSVRNAVDKSDNFGEYILTGSATLSEEELKKIHPGVGRFAFVDMRPMSLYESGFSNGKISLKEILNGKRDIDGIKSNLSYEDIAEVICRGGWPRVVDSPLESALKVPFNYINALVSSDISRVDGVERNADLMRVILKSYARNVCTINSNQSIIDDVKANYESIHENTILSYINVLKKLYIIEEIPAWNPNIRSKTSIRTSPKKTFIDPSLAVAALGITPKELIYDPNTMGLLFENLVNRDLAIYTSPLGGTLSHYRDRFGLECDNVIHFENGKYALIEVKLGIKQINNAKEHLRHIVELIKKHNTEDKKNLIPLPEFMMIITGENIAYTTEDNIMIVPIGSLRD